MVSDESMNLYSYENDEDEAPQQELEAAWKDFEIYLGCLAMYMMSALLKGKADFKSK
jgi:hypothetical protein